MRYIADVSTPIKANISGFQQHVFAIHDMQEEMLVCLCPSIAVAKQVEHALNFNHRPQDYDYRFMPQGEE